MDKKRSLNQRISYLLSLGISAKLLNDTTIQIFNPFLPMIAAGAGLSVVALGGIVALRSMMGFTSPLMGVLADRIGYKRVMQVNLAITGLAMIAAGLSRSIFVFALTVIVSGIGSSGYTPILHAYLSTKLPYKKRALGIGIVEYSWALAGIAGLFTAGYLIKEFSWRAPFLFFGILLVAAAVFYQTLPVSRIKERAAENRESESISLKTIQRKLADFFNFGVHAPSVWGTIAVQGFNFFAIMQIMIIHGGWLIGEYGADSLVMGRIALLFGAGDLTAAVLVSLFADRIGKRRSVMIGVAGMSAGFVLMPFLNINLNYAVAGILLPRFFFEFATISNLALLTEQFPSERGKIMSIGTAVGLAGITAAAALGPVDYIRWGVPGLAVISFIPGLVSFSLLLFVVHEKAAFRSLEGKEEL